MEGKASGTLGNTSACAEKTMKTEAVASLFQKHLRLRGENYIKINITEIVPETPPLARRKHF